MLKKLLKARLFKSVGNGLLDSVPILSNIKTNINSSEGGEGNIDWVRLVTAVGTIVLALYLVSQVISGTLTTEDAKELFKIFS